VNNSPLRKSTYALNQAKAQLQHTKRKFETYDIGINTIKQEKRDIIKMVTSSKAPKIRPQTAKPKMKKKKKKGDQESDEESVGEKIT